MGRDGVGQGRHSGACPKGRGWPASCCNAVTPSSLPVLGKFDDFRDGRAATNSANRLASSCAALAASAARMTGDAGDAVLSHTAQRPVRFPSPTNLCFPPRRCQDLRQSRRNGRWVPSDESPVAVPAPTTNVDHDITEMPLLGGSARLPYAKTSLRAQQRAMRDQMRALGLSHRQIAFEFARRYKLRSRAAWRYAHGWSLTEAAKRITSYAVEAGLGHGVTTVAMSSSHLCEVESWPGQGPKPSGRRPTPYLLSLLAAVYGCAIADLLDVADYEHMRPADRLILDKTAPPDGQRENPAVSTQTGWDLSVQPGHGELGLDRAGAKGAGSDPETLIGVDAAGASDVFGRIMQANWPGAAISPLPCLWPRLAC
jgi:hypothetical protein